MRRARRPLSVLALFVATLTPATAAEPSKEPTVEQLVRELGAPDYQARQAAAKKLWAIGEPARKALEDATTSGSLEAATRAQAILDQLDWGIRADTPKDTLDLIRKFRTGDFAAQAAVVRTLLDGDEGGLPYLRILLAKPVAPDPNNRSDFNDPRAALFATVVRAVRERVPVLLFDGKDRHADGLIDLLPLGPSQDGYRDYTAYLAARGRVKNGLARLEAATADPLPRVFLHRAAGNSDAARKLLGDLAKDDPRLTDLYESLLADTAAWGELVDRSTPRPNSVDGLKAFRLRLAGRADEADTLLKSMVNADTPESARGYAVESNAVGLFLNGRTADGLTRLKAAESAPHVAADILAARLDFAAAFDLIRAGLADDHGTQHDGGEDAHTRRQLHTLYKLKKGRLLAQLGERDAAAQIFATLGDMIVRADRSVQVQVIQAAARSGFPDIAAELLGRIQARRDEDGDTYTPPGLYDPVEALFEADADAARFWWPVARKARPKADAGEVMRTVRDLLTGKLPTAQVRELMTLETAQRTTTPPSEPTGGYRGGPPRFSSRRPIALAAAYRAAGDLDKAIECLTEYTEKASPRRRRFFREPDAVDGSTSDPSAARSWVYGLDESFRIWIDLGDLLTEQGKHTEAAKRLEQGWRLMPDNPILLYLSGRALAKVGQEAEGKRRMELAHLVPLGNVQLRGRFLEELISRGCAADMRTESARIRDIAWSIDGSSVGNVWNQVGRAAVVLKEFAAAADAQLRSMHFVLRTSGIVYVEGYAYANLPCLVRGLQARTLVARGGVSEALAAADEALAIVPTHTETITGLVRDLDAAGKKTEADALFRRGWDAYAALLKQHPHSGWLKYSAAWLAAGCNRELTTAGKYAAEAVDAEPTHRGYRECLAEVKFRGGDRDKPLELMKALAAEDRRNWHYKRQLERYKTGAFDSPPPFTDE